MSTTIVSSGTAVFQITVALLDSASQFTPARLMSVKTSMSTTATTRPRPTSAPFASTIPGQMWSR